MEKTVSQNLDKREERLRVLIKEGKEVNREQLFRYVENKGLKPLGKEPFSINDIGVIFTFLSADISENNYQDLIQYLFEGSPPPLSPQGLRNLRSQCLQYIIQASTGKVDTALGTSLLNTYEELHKSSGSKCLTLCLCAGYNVEFLDRFRGFLKQALQLKLMEGIEDEWVKYRSWLEDRGFEHSFGHYLRWLRESKNLSYREASEKTGVEHSHLYHLEKNDKSPSRDTAIKITESLDGNRTFGQIAAGYWPEEWASNQYLFSLFDREQYLLKGPTQEVDSTQYDSLGEFLRDLRKERGLTQEEVASNLSITRSYLPFIEHDQRKPSYEVLEELAGFYGIEPKVLKELREKGRS